MGDEPVQARGPRRARVSLDGAWRFSPALNNTARPLPNDGNKPYVIYHG